MAKQAKKRKGDVKEDISNLQFGEDFGPEAGVEALFNAEVKVFASACVLLHPRHVQSDWPGSGGCGTMWEQCW